MTRAREKQIRQECAEGKHSFDADYLIKQEKKRERAIEKQRISIAKKAVKATMSEYAKIIAENENLKREVESLKGEINRLKAICDSNSDIVEEPAKLYDNPDDIDWRNEVPEDDIERDAWINEHCSEACKQKIQEEFEAEIEKNMPDQGFDYGKEAEKVKKMLEDPEFIECANAKANDDIDESEAMVIPTANSQKVIEFALKQRGTKDELVSLVLSKKLVPIDDSFRFYYCKINGQSSVIEPAADKIHQIDNVGDFKVGCRYYSFDSSCCKAFSEKRNDKYFYANRYLTYVWKNSRNDYSRIQRELSDELGYKATRDFK